MAVLTSTGITFSNATVLNSKYGIIPQLSSMVFLEASAPTGWVQVTTHDDKTLRVVSGTGAGSGGSFSYSTLNSVPFSVSVPITATGLTVGDTTLGDSQIPSHTHTVTMGGTRYNLNIGNQQPDSNVPSPGSTGNNAPAGGAHTHPITFSSASGPLSGSINMFVNYVDVIICSFT